MPIDRWRSFRIKQIQKKAKSEMASHGRYLSFEYAYEDFSSAKDNRSSLKNKNTLVKASLVRYLNFLRNKCNPSLKLKIPRFSYAPKYNDESAILLFGYGLEIASEVGLDSLKELVLRIGPQAEKEVRRLAQNGNSVIRKSSQELLRMLGNVLSSSTQTECLNEAIRLTSEVVIKPALHPVKDPCSQCDPGAKCSKIDVSLVFGKWKRMIRKSKVIIEFTQDGMITEQGQVIGTYMIDGKSEIRVSKFGSSQIFIWSVTGLTCNGLVLKSSNGGRLHFSRVK